MAELLLRFHDALALQQRLRLGLTVPGQASCIVEVNSNVGMRVDPPWGNRERRQIVGDRAGIRGRAPVSR